jgi:hypothetical protein
MNDILIGTLLGLGGGIIRAAAGIIKYRAFKNFKAKSTILTLVTSAAIGLITAIIVAESYKYAALTGYVGADLIDNFFKKLK